MCARARVRERDRSPPSSPAPHVMLYYFSLASEDPKWCHRTTVVFSSFSRRRVTNSRQCRPRRPPALRHWRVSSEIRAYTSTCRRHELFTLEGFIFLLHSEQQSPPISVPERIERSPGGLISFIFYTANTFVTEIACAPVSRVRIIHPDIETQNS